MKNRNKLPKKILLVCMIAVFGSCLITGCTKGAKSVGDSTTSTDSLNDVKNSLSDESKKEENQQNNEDNTDSNNQDRTNNNIDDEIDKIHSDPTNEEIDLSDKFRGVRGCAVIYDPQNKKYEYYNKEMCEKQTSPYSSFKIISTLLGLEYGVLQDENTTMKYSGKEYGIASWNKNLTLQEAFDTSCVWYFRQVVDQIGKKKIKKNLNKLGYGNCDISEWEGSQANPGEDLNGFWLESSLKISPLEQVNVLSQVFEDDTTYNKEKLNILKSIMLVDDSTENKIYGKTGTFGTHKGWFVGFCETYTQKRYFAIYLSDKKHEATGKVAKQIAIKLMK